MPFLQTPLGSSEKKGDETPAKDEEIKFEKTPGMAGFSVVLLLSHQGSVGSSWVTTFILMMHAVYIGRSMVE